MQENQSRSGPGEFQRQIDDLRARVDRDRADIDGLESRADHAYGRADASEDRSDDDHRKIADLEARLDVNEKIIAELQMEGLIDKDHAVHLQEALRTSRMIGAAIGIVMATRKVSEVEAFALLTRVSQDTNRKVRVLAYEVVSSGDVSGLPIDSTPDTSRDGPG